ncbi:TonB family protein [Sorangium atrum]|uniref:TonB family protein n=1 Tax=Sorangium atrum TaxID=2995308 RepID=A0ABT5CA40_9BACT|nr:TonB family protein [Sorangium aterium]MDC0682011.1 TonB family protein [Sorangium aterium]
MAQRSRDGRRIASAWALSVAAHAGLVGAGALAVAGSFSAREVARARTVGSPAAVSTPIEIELPVVSDGTLDRAAATAPELAVLLSRGGGEAAPRPDTGTSGRGGTDAAELPALNLADRDDAIFLSPEIRSRLDRSQIQRIRSSPQRASREDWRASREPMELTFLAGGRVGRRPERRTSADRDPSLGARDGGAPQRRGGVLGAAAQPAGIDGASDEPAARDATLSLGAGPRAVGGAVEGGARASAGLGVRDARPGEDHRESAAVPLARPMVAVGTPSVPADAVGHPNDTVDSEQEVATAIQSLVHASSAGGVRGFGPGGQEGPGATGAGGVAGRGARSSALGSGRGRLLDNDPLDRRRSHYMRQVMAKLHPLWADAFPKWAAGEGLQGTVIVTFVIRADGTVGSASVTRPSGIPEFDENCRRAVLRGSPYPPVPPELGESFRWSMPFDAKNPAVLPKHRERER